MIQPGAPYRPSNGTEGEIFFESWCTKCARDAHMNSGKDYDECEESEICPIIADAFRGQVKEWVWKGEPWADGSYPMCTAFVPVGQPIPGPTAEELEAAGQTRLIA